MARARWRKRWKPDPAGRRPFAPPTARPIAPPSPALPPPVVPFLSAARRALGVAFAYGLVTLVARTAAADTVLLPSAEGRFGAWLALGPVSLKAKGKRAVFTLETPLLPGAEEETLVGKLGRAVTVNGAPEGENETTTSATWRVIHSTGGAIDVGAALGQRGPEAFAFLYGVLHLTEPLKGGALMLGAADGARIWIDRKVVSTNDAVRLEHDDEDVVRLDLAAGDHPILIKLHHRDNWWVARVRVVDATLAAPRGATLRLPGTTEADTRVLAQKLTDITVDRGLTATDARPTVSVSFREGFPKGTDRAVRIAVESRAGGKVKPLYAVDGGEIPLGDSGPSELKVRLPPLTADEMAEAENGGEIALTVEVAGRKLEAALSPRPFARKALAAADRAIGLAAHPGSTFLSDPAVTVATLEHLRERFARAVNAGDPDADALTVEARTLVEYAADLESKKDPLRAHAGIRRFAYRSPLDGELAPFGLYVPASYLEPRAPAGRTYPLVIVLHGLNGKPLSVMRWFFGHDDEGRDSEWEDRHPGEVEPAEGFVLAPNAHGNAMYRELGEADVMKLLDWAESFYPIDKGRITITGVSMGGTGTASIALRYPHRFAAAEPLCGYHSYFIRGDIFGRRMLPWERQLAEQRSNTSWADNGLYLPLYVWHGKRDYPEKNSGVLIDRYQALGYEVEHEHPEIGHDVWKRAYEGLGGFRWLSQKARPAHKKRVVFKTDSSRYLDDAWVHLREIATELEFATIDASIVDPLQIEVTTRAVEAFALDREPELVSAAAPVRVKIDGATLTFDPSSPIAAYREDGAWKAGVKPAAPGRKRGGLSGPIRDIFFEPLAFVYGTADPRHTRANRETARAWAKIKWGVDVRYPILADTEVDEQLKASRSLVLVGNAESNRVVRELEAELPFRVAGRTISAVSGDTVKKQWSGRDLGVAFVYPNPKHPERYVLVLEGTTPLGTYRSIALPELLPDFMVFDDRIAAARGQILLGGASALAAGNFRGDWSFARLDASR